jgi:hypothetical protein
LISSWMVVSAAILLAALGVNQRDHILYTCARTVSRPFHRFDVTKFSDVHAFRHVYIDML